MGSTRDERPLSALPRWIPTLVAAALVLQVAWSRLAAESGPSSAGALPPAPPSAALLRTGAMGEEAAFARMGMLWLQSLDGGGASGAPYRDFDYGRLRSWLGVLLRLDPESLYPLFAASRVYAENPSPDKMRQMLAFVAEAYEQDPNRRWPALAQATLLAKHRLKDLPLALRYATALRERTTDPAVPLWARQMDVFILEDMNELQAAKIVLGGLLATGRLQDPGERRFLESRLRALESRINKDLETSPHKR